MKNDSFSSNLLEPALEKLWEGFQIIGFDWTYLYVNNAVCEQARKNRSELLGKNIWEVFPALKTGAVYEALHYCMKNRERKEIENKFRHPDGKEEWFELRIEPVEQGLFILSVDISERKMYESHREHYTSNLEKMISMTSHRVRQPVSQILGFSEILNTTSNTLHELTEISGYMRTAALKLDEYTREMMSLIEKMKQQSALD